MRLLADECCDRRLVRALREAGHDVAYIAESAATAEDWSVLALAREQGRVLITDDKDFGFHTIREAQDACGVLFLRLPQMAIVDVVGRVINVISTQGAKLQRRFTVVEPARTRSRHLPSPAVPDESVEPS